VFKFNVKNNSKNCITGVGKTERDACCLTASCELNCGHWNELGNLESCWEKQAKKYCLNYIALDFELISLKYCLNYIALDSELISLVHVYVYRLEVGSQMCIA